MPTDLAAGGLPRDAVPSAAELTSLVSAAVGHRAAVGQWSAETVPYQSGSPATGALARLRGVTADGEPWSVFVKVLQHPRHWRLLNRVPDEVREDFLASFPWRAELGAGSPRSRAASRPGSACPRCTASSSCPRTGSPYGWKTSPPVTRPGQRPGLTWPRNASARWPR